MMRIGAYGEVMMRLTPPEYRTLEQTHSLRMDFTGTGVNLLGNLAHFGLTTSMLTQVPANRLGDTAKASLRSYGIQTAFVGKKYSHIGSYFAEIGYGARPTYVTYQNRHHSSFGVSGPEEYAIDGFLETVDLIHICGISLSLTERTWQTALALAKQAHVKQIRVCFDFNFRPSLNEELNREVLKQRYETILPYCDLVFGSVRDLEELLAYPLEETEGAELALIQSFIDQYQLEWFCGTRRLSVEDKQFISGRIITAQDAYETAPQLLQVLDRIGAGDAYAAGVLLGYAEKWSLQRTADFAITNAVLAHTMLGDVPLTTKEQVEQVLQAPGKDLIR
ncbi:2-dehydro-3-deoxygluconokinase [Enterococcus sp. AZ089]|uniref:sugar kinase n=1 Tax=unclassified Enterococcus TaxID=2608891 RepID=UPI001FD072AB|nr:sugar kinase [Enterococcus casseliflavus]